MKWVRTDVKVIGSENIPDVPVVVISNHQAAFDIPLLFSVLTNKPSFIAKIELSRIPLFASWMRMLGCLFIDRSSPRKGLESFKKAAEMIKKGQSVILFPEGTRRPTIIPFKKGSFKLPLMAEVPILPVTITGTEKITANFKAGKRSGVTVIIDKPVNISALDKDKRNIIHEDIRALILANFEKYSDK
ncbi:MAG TPA: lysophospholipid acyltransferase family protein [Clostridiales bacterium]|nr:lysophospholipid acyltransferase family protein [Clostridiales bacterium]HQP69099.1 lysophospholipid acyltransferase family protein [Clostridiales bacterium]